METAKERMKKTKVLVNLKTSLVVSHPDWDDDELKRQLHNIEPEVYIQCLGDTDEFPDLEYNEHGERCLSFIDLV